MSGGQTWALLGVFGVARVEVAADVGVVVLDLWDVGPGFERVEVDFEQPCGHAVVRTQLTSHASPSRQILPK